MKKFFLLLVLVFLLAACGSNNNEDTAAIDMQQLYDVIDAVSASTSDIDFALSELSAPPAPTTPPAREAAQAADESFEYEPLELWSFETEFLSEPAVPRMIIRSADIGLSTYYFEDTVAGIERIMQNRGGFIESSHQWMVSASHDSTTLLWRSNFTLRVPVGLFDQVNRELTALAQVQRFGTVSQDVTLEYSDLGSRLRIREEELRRAELMLVAATALNDILNLEAQVTNLRLAVDAYRRRMTEIDQLASFSTIRLAVYETVIIEEEEYEEEEDQEEDDEEDEYYPVYYDDGFGRQIRDAFIASVDFMTSIFIGIAMFLAYVGLPAILIGAVLYLLYRMNKRYEVIKLRPRA